MGRSCSGRRPDEECVDASEARGDEKAMLAWTPDPWQADPGRSSHARRSSDVVATLVDIYGTKALVSECGRSRCRSHAHVAPPPPPLSLAPPRFVLPHPRTTRYRAMLLRPAPRGTRLRHHPRRQAPRAPQAAFRRRRPPPLRDHAEGCRGVTPHHARDPRPLRRRDGADARRDGRLASLLAAARQRAARATAGDRARGGALREAVRTPQGATQARVASEPWLRDARRRILRPRCARRHLYAVARNNPVALRAEKEVGATRAGGGSQAAPRDHPEEARAVAQPWLHRRRRTH